MFKSEIAQLRERIEKLVAAEEVVTDAMERVRDAIALVAPLGKIEEFNNLLVATVNLSEGGEAVSQPQVSHKSTISQPQVSDNSAEDKDEAEDEAEEEEYQHWLSNNGKKEETDTTGSQEEEHQSSASDTVQAEERGETLQDSSQQTEAETIPDETVAVPTLPKGDRVNKPTVGAYEISNTGKKEEANLIGSEDETVSPTVTTQTESKRNNSGGKASGETSESDRADLDNFHVGQKFTNTKWYPSETFTVTKVCANGIIECKGEKGHPYAFHYRHNKFEWLLPVTEKSDRTVEIGEDGEIIPLVKAEATELIILSDAIAYLKFKGEKGKVLATYIGFKTKATARKWGQFVEGFSAISEWEVREPKRLTEWNYELKIVGELPVTRIQKLAAMDLSVMPDHLKVTA